MRLDYAKAVIDALIRLRDSATDEQALAVPVLYPTWRVGESYEAGKRVLYNEVLYTVLTTHTSQSDWTPDVAAALFAKVLIPDPEIVPGWEQPESTNPYSKGDKVTHNGMTWVSLVDNNVWEPGVYGWEEVAA